MKLRQGSAAIVISLIALFAFALPVAAHELAANNGISAELHIPPLDQPIATQPTALQFTFEEAPPTFSLPDCDCRVQATGPVEPALGASAQLDPRHTDRLTSTVTFPKAGAYTVTLSGYTTRDHEAQFHLSYPVNVDPAPMTVSNTSRLISNVAVALGAVAAVVVLVFYQRDEQKRRHRHSHPE